MTIGARAVIFASCQPLSSDQRIVAIWSVKTRPKPGFTIRAARSLAATPIVQMVGSLPLTPAGLGTQQGAMLHLFGGIGPGATSAPAILAFGFAFPIVLMGMRCAIGLCYLGRLRRVSERGGRADGRGGAVHARAGPAER